MRTSRDRERALDQWLGGYDATLLWEERINQSMSIRCYKMTVDDSTRVVIVQCFGSRIDPISDGWELFIPASSSNNIEATLAEADIRLSS